MMGQPIRGGTSFSQILLDEQAFMRLMNGLPPLKEGEEYQEEDEEEATREEIDEALFTSETDPCSTASLKMNISLPPATAVLDEPDMDVQILEVPSA